MIPTIGRIVHYQLTEDDAAQINKRRADAEMHMREHRKNATGVQIHVGNVVRMGETFPMMITKVYETDTDNHVAGQVYLDGNDAYWVRAARFGSAAGTWGWPPRV